LLLTERISSSLDLRAAETFEDIFSEMDGIHRIRYRRSQFCPRKIRMNRDGKKVLSVLVFTIVLFFLLASSSTWAQDARASVSGTVTDPTGKAVTGAKVTVKNVASGETSEAQTDAVGHYSIANLAAGNYEVTAVGEGIGTNSTKVTLSAGEQTVNLPLAAGSAPYPEAPNAPSSSQAAPASKTEPSLEDLGFSKAQQQGNPQQQALLDKRTHMLKIHQRMGLITTIPMIASVVTSLNSGGRSEGTASRDLHVALGALTGDLYGITAYYAIRAPKVPGTETRGGIKLHKALAWVHGTGMVLTPILGAMAFSQKNNGEKVHGIAQAHGPVAIVTAGAFGAALLSVSVKF